MTPFVDNVLTGLSYFYEAVINAYCYFFGHKWGAWQDTYGDFPLGQIRECDRCGEYEHDSQAIKNRCKPRPLARDINGEGK